MANEETKERGKQVGFTVPEDLFDALEEVREKTGITLSHLGRQGLWNEVANVRKTHPAYEPKPETATV